MLLLSSHTSQSVFMLQVPLAHGEVLERSTLNFRGVQSPTHSFPAFIGQLTFWPPVQPVAIQWTMMGFDP